MYKFPYWLGLACLLANPAVAQLTAATPSPVSAMSDPGPVLSLQAAQALALEKNAGIAAAGNEVKAVEGALQQAGARPNPELAATMEDTRKSTRTTTYQLNQAIELGGKRGARIDAAERGRDAALLELAIKRSEIRGAVTTAYFGVLGAQERQRLAQDTLKLASTAAVMAGRRVTAGKISPVEETKARVVESSARLELNQASSELLTARKRLAALWGDNALRYATVEGRLDGLPALPEISDIVARVPNAPALRLAKIEVTRRQALARVETSKRVPDLTVSLGSKRDEEARRNMWVIGVSVPLPLFDTNQGNVREALHRTDKARDELQLAENRLDLEVAEAYERLRNAHQEATALQQDILPAAQSAYDAAGKGFELGKFSFLEVLDAQRTLFQARLQYLRTLSQGHGAAVEIDRLLGDDELTK